MSLTERSFPTFAFLVHPRSVSDIRRRFPFLRFFPDVILERGLEYIGPVLVERVKGMTRKDGNSTADGIIMSVPMTARRMLANRSRAALYVRKTIRAAKRYGVNYIGLGSLTSPVVGGGIDIVGQEDVHVTNGNALTAVMTMRGIAEAARIKNIHLQDMTCAVVGATGSIGAVVSESLVRDLGVRRMILLGRTPENLVRLKTRIDEIATNIQSTTSVDMSIISSADVVVVATSGSGTLILPEHLKTGALVYDITQPQNVDGSVKELRPDVTVIDGALIYLPEGILPPKIFGLPQGTSFSCFAETMIIAALDLKRDFSIGNVSCSDMDIIEVEADRLGFSLASLTSWGNILS